ncbi:hypothetical protein [Massilia consociata]|uniref:Uncharacterized protein n=1 Tax=Massilia consociata TaxID=760117 RepID=A0ABV6FLK9_9BURK
MKASHTMIAGLALALASAGASAAGAPDPRFFPAPGLYKIETRQDSTAHNPAGKAQSRTAVDAATGAGNTSYRRIDGVAGSFATPGDGPQQVCIRPVKAGSLPQGMQIDGCSAGKGQVVGDSMVSSSSCPWGKVETRIRRIDARTWETTAHTTMTGAPSVADTAGGLLAMRRAAEKMAKEGTAEERAEARAFLEESKGLEAELQKHQKAALPAAAMKSGAGPVQEYRTVQRMTRIGDCKG